MVFVRAYQRPHHEKYVLATFCCFACFLCLLALNYYNLAYNLKVLWIFRTNSLKRIKNAKWQVKDCPPELLLGDISRRLSTEVTPAAIAQNNRTFVEKLLKVTSKKYCLEVPIVFKVPTEPNLLKLKLDIIFQVKLIYISFNLCNE